MSETNDPGGDADDPFFSVVVPLFNEEGNLSELYERLTAVMEGLARPYEVIFVDDGSRDSTPEKVRELHDSDPRIRLIRFSRNFGHHIAITAGLDEARGERIIMMDGDLQDRPEAIPDLFAKLEEGFDVVYGIRAQKKHSLFKRVTSWMFVTLMRQVTTENAEITTNIFRIMTRQVADAVRECREQARFVVGLFSWVGFRQTAIEVIHGARHAGETKYSLAKMFRLAFNGITSFSRLPLQVASLLGMAVSVGAFGLGCYYIVMKLQYDTQVTGWTSTLVVILFLSGVQLLCLGVLGSYIGRIYGEAQNRPLYVVAERLGKGPPDPHIGRRR
ncbi:MAG: glycosyltransferase [Sandaracinaceae bacterium]